MEEYLISKIKEMKGSLLGIGINSEKIKGAIEKNDKIISCNLLENTSGFSKKKLSFPKRMRKVNIKKLRRTFKKKRIDNVICNYNTIDEFTKYFVRESVYVNCGMLYVYGEKEALLNLKRKYERYTDDIKLEKSGEGFVLIVNNKNTKTNKIKDMGYWWVDTFNDFIEFLTIILVN